MPRCRGSPGWCPCRPFGKGPGEGYTHHEVTVTLLSFLSQLSPLGWIVLLLAPAIVIRATGKSLAEVIVAWRSTPTEKTDEGE